MAATLAGNSPKLSLLFFGCTYRRCLVTSCWLLGGCINTWRFPWPRHSAFFGHDFRVQSLSYACGQSGNNTTGRKTKFFPPNSGILAVQESKGSHSVQFLYFFACFNNTTGRVIFFCQILEFLAVQKSKFFHSMQFLYFFACFFFLSLFSRQRATQLKAILISFSVSSAK